MQTFGSRAQVMHGTAMKTSGGLTKKNLPRKYFRELTKEEINILRRL